MKIRLIAAPYDSGYYRERLGLGPLTLISGIEEQLQHHGHSVKQEEIFIDIPFSTEVTASFEVSRQISRHVREAVEDGEFPITLTGNCNAAAIGTLAGLNDDTGVIWFDCHGDFNTPETTIGGFLDGMALSMVAGQCWQQLITSVKGFNPVDENNIILIGARDFDPLELERIHRSSITLITPEMMHIDRNVVVEKVIPAKSIYVHIDLDVLDTAYITANTYAKTGGISPEQLYNAAKLLKSNYVISAAAITAYDPSLDPARNMQEIVNTLVTILVN